MEYHFRPKSQGIDQKKLILITIVIIAFILVIGINSFLKTYEPLPVTTTTTTTTTTQPETTGNVLIAVKDVKRRVPVVGDVWGLELTVTEVSVHRASDQSNETNITEENETGEWITVFAGSKTFDLITLQDVSGVIADSPLEPGKYTQIRMTIGSGSIKIYNDLIAAYNKTYPLIVPSESLKFIHPFEIDIGETTALTIDFDVEKSVEKLDNKYLLKPTVAITELKLGKGGQLPNSVSLEGILDYYCLN